MTTTTSQISQETSIVHELARIYGFNASEALQKLALLPSDMADLSPGDQHEADAMNVAVELSGREQMQRIYEHEDAQVAFGKDQRQGNWSSEEQQVSSMKSFLSNKPLSVARTQKAAVRIGKQATRALVRAAKAAEKAQKAAERAQKAAERERKAAEKAAEKETKAAERAAAKQTKAAIRIGKQATRALLKAAKEAQKAQKAAEKGQKAAEKAEKGKKAAETHAQC